MSTMHKSHSRRAYFCSYYAAHRFDMSIPYTFMSVLNPFRGGYIVTWLKRP